jgi:hypothetical protein
MTVQFVEPFQLAWRRMTLALFKPFDLHKWFVVGFNAFLAGLLDASNGGGGSRAEKGGNFGSFIHFPRTAWDWLQSHPGWAIAILFGVLVAVAVFVVLTWASSRGVFMFLSSVVHDRVEIAGPWRDYQKEGNSLFVWRLLFGVFSIVVFGGLFAYFFVRGAALYDSGLSTAVPLGFIIGFGLLTLAIVLVWGYIALFLKEFVAALMFKHRISAGEAWTRFLSLFKSQALPFIGFGIITFLLMLVFVFAVVVAGFATCCIGFLILIVPYISTVVTLPVWYAYRAFSLEFLAQFGPEYDVFPRQAASVPAPAVPAAPAV